MLDKICDDVKCDYDVTLVWTVSARNALINHNGFSPAELVFGKASDLPSTINDHLPALESTIRSVDLAYHVFTIHAARQTFITSEASEKIKLFLKKNIRKAFISREMKFITNKTHLHNGNAQLKSWVKMDLCYSLDMVQDILKLISANYN